MENGAAPYRRKGGKTNLNSVVNQVDYDYYSIQKVPLFKLNNGTNLIGFFDLRRTFRFYFLLIARSIATATDTVAPTIGLLPIPRNPIISTCAGTVEEPAN